LTLEKIRSHRLIDTKRPAMSRISRGYFPNQKPSEISSSLYASIFIRDVYTGIMPYGFRKESKFKAELTRKNQKLEDNLKELLDIGHRSGWSLSEAVSGAIETLSHYLITFGEVHLEIVCEKDETGTTNKSLEFLPQGVILKVFNNYVQFVPLTNWVANEKKFYVIPANKIWHIKLPKSLGTPRSHRRLLKKLVLLSEPMPEFALKDNTLGNSNKYDFVAHHDKKELAVEQITAAWGSFPSLRRIKHTTEYYFIMHGLQFAHSKSILREHVLCEINRLLENLGIKNSIKISGLVSAAEVEGIITKLESGEIGFAEAVEKTKE